MKAASRYMPSSFQHNARVAAVLLPSIVILVGFGGKLPAGVLILGAMVCPSPHVHAVSTRSLRLGCHSLLELEMCCRFPYPKLMLSIVLQFLALHVSGNLHHGCNALPERRHGCHLDHSWPGQPEHDGLRGVLWRLEPPAACRPGQPAQWRTALPDWSAPCLSTELRPAVHRMHACKHLHSFHTEVHANGVICRCLGLAAVQMATAPVPCCGAGL